jgi:excisionase family DNA binding protein
LGAHNIWYDLVRMGTIGDVLRPIDEVAEALGVGRATLFRMIKREQIAKYKRQGDRRTFVDDEQVRRALGFQRISGPEPEG